MKNEKQMQRLLRKLRSSHRLAIRAYHDYQTTGASATQLRHYARYEKYSEEFDAAMAELEKLLLGQ